LDDRSIIVTGAAGFIGSNVISELNKMGIDKEIIVVDDFHHSPKWKNLIQKKTSDLLSRYEFFEWIHDRPDEVKAIVHLGANSSTRGTDGDLYYELNYRYTIELARFAADHGIRFIYASSASTYGDGSEGFSDNHEYIDYLKPLNLYGFSKHMTDQWMLRNDMLDQVVGLKFFNVYGPFEAHKGQMASMVYHMYHQIKKDGKVKLFKSNHPSYKDGDHLRDFIYVKDAAKIVVEFLFNDKTGIYNVGTGNPRTFNDMAKAIFKSMDLAPSIEYIHMPEDLSKTYQNYTKAEMDKLSDIMNLPNTSLEDGVDEYVREYLQKGVGC
jgi:ADP-L-glycero-D-manno-heptose 6-epimerase